MNREEIDDSQVFWLTVAIIMPTIILIVPRILVGEGKQLGWLSIIVSGFSMGGTLLYCFEIRL